MRALLLSAVMMISAPLSPSAQGADPGACTDKAGKSGKFEVQISSGGLTRTYLLRVPASYSNTTPTPLVFNFHGWTMTAALQESYTKMTAVSDSEGFILVYPQGIGNSWNGGETCCGVAVRRDIDDVGFAVDMVQAISADYCVDPTRIYSTGFSNGAYLSHRLACEQSEVFAAIGPGAGVIDVPECTPLRPVPVIQGQGVDDLLVPYQKARRTHDYWVAYNQCIGEPEVVYQQGPATCIAYTQCLDGSTVEWCEVEGMGHAWPTGQEQYGGIEYSRAFWEFFKRHPLLY